MDNEATIKIIKSLLFEFLDPVSPCEEGWLICNRACLVPFGCNALHACLRHPVQIVEELSAFWVAFLDASHLHSLLFTQHHRIHEVNLVVLYLEVLLESDLDSSDFLMEIEHGSP